MGSWRGKEEQKKLEALLGSKSNHVAISEKFRIIMLSNRTKRGFNFTLSMVSLENEPSYSAQNIIL